MALLLYILVSVFVVSLISLLGVFALLMRKRLLERALSLLVGFAAGALLSAAFFDLFPESIERTGVERTFLFALIGIVMFFILEKFFYWYHCHGGRCAHHGRHHAGHEVKPYAYLNLLGDSIHNFVDGMAIAGAYMASIPLGLVASLAVIFHEIPQEIGDFAILVNAGLSKWKALMLNFVTALTAFLGALLAFAFSYYVQGFESFLLPFAAGNFLYIATADLIPELHKEESMQKNLAQMGMFLLGIIMILVVNKLIA